MIILNKRIVIIVVLLLCIISYFVLKKYTKEQFDDIETHFTV